MYVLVDESIGPLLFDLPDKHNEVGLFALFPEYQPKVVVEIEPSLIENQGPPEQNNGLVFQPDPEPIDLQLDPLNHAFNRILVQALIQQALLYHFRIHPHIIKLQNGHNKLICHFQLLCLPLAIHLYKRNNFF